MKLHGSRYALTSALGALTTGLLAIQFGYLGLFACIFVGLFSAIIIPYEQDGTR